MIVCWMVCWCWHPVWLTNLAQFENNANPIHANNDEVNTSFRRREFQHVVKQPLGGEMGGRGVEELGEGFDWIIVVLHG